MAKMTKREEELAHRVANVIGRRRESQLTPKERAVVLEAMQVLFDWGVVDWSAPNPNED